MAEAGIEVSNETSLRADGSATKTVRLEAFHEIDIPSGAKTAKLVQDRGVWSLEYTLDAEVAEKKGKAVSIRGATTQEPLATHPAFASITDEEWEKYWRWEQDPEDPTLNSWSPLVNGSAKMLIYHKKRIRGITDYFRPSVSVRVTESNQGGVNLAGLGKIKSPGISLSVPDGGNWLLVSVEGDDPGDGSKFTVAHEYLASGKSGWDKDLYGTGAA